MVDLSARASAVSVLTAIEAGDQDKFDQAFKTVSDEAVDLLKVFLAEVASGQHKIFNKNDAPKLYENSLFARAVLVAWKKVGYARGRMAARMAFETVLDSSRRAK